MRKSTIYHILVILILLLVPLSGMAQQNTDINKPTRSRVTNQDKKSADNKNNKKSAQDNKQTDKNVGKQSNKGADKKNEQSASRAVEAAATKKENAKAPAETASKPAEKKSGDAQAASGTNLPVTDTAKAAPPKPAKPKRVPVDPDKVQFDGIDVSKHQGTIDWEELRKNQKIQFVYIKATEGSNYTDPRYRQNINNARKHGFKVGSYHFFTDLSSATSQFKNFINIAKREEQDLIPVIDVEKRSKWTPQQMRDSVKVFADLLEDYYGCKPIIYTFETFYNRNLGKAFEKYPIFIAKYPKGQEVPNINGIKWILWQFSESGKFRGVKENLVDMSRFNKGCSINDILYKPGKYKPKNSSVRDAVDHKDKPSTVNMTEQKPKEAPTQSKKQQEEAKKQAEKDKKAKERNKKLAEDEAKKKAEADKKAKEKAEQKKRQQARQQAHDAEVKREAEAKAKAKQEAEAKAKREADAKAKRKAEAQKAREQKAQQSKKSGKSASLMNASSSKLSQSQRNDSIRAAKQKGHKTNKSSADND